MYPQIHLYNVFRFINDHYTNTCNYDFVSGLLPLLGSFLGVAWGINGEGCPWLVVRRVVCVGIFFFFSSIYMVLRHVQGPPTFEVGASFGFLFHLEWDFFYLVT
jgi:hypothetical protein